MAKSWSSECWGTNLRGAGWSSLGFALVSKKIACHRCRKIRLFIWSQPARLWYMPVSVIHNRRTFVSISKDTHGSRQFDWRQVNRNELLPVALSLNDFLCSSSDTSLFLLTTSFDIHLRSLCSKSFTVVNLTFLDNDSPLVERIVFAFDLELDSGSPSAVRLARLLRFGISSSTLVMKCLNVVFNPGEIAKSLTLGAYIPNVDFLS